jgi:TolB-like protein
MKPIRKDPKSIAADNARMPAQQRFAFGPFTLDASRGTLLRDGEPVPLGHRAVSLLQALVCANGEIVTKSELIDAGWPNLVVEESNLSVQIAALRKVLGDIHDGRNPIATIARVGYRFCMPVTRELPGPGSPLTPAGHPRPAPSVAVLPLVNLVGDAGQDYFADGVTEDLIMALSRFRWFRVAGRSSSFAFKGRAARAREVAEQLGVSYVLEGSVRKTAGRMRITLQLTEAAGESQIWGERYDFDAGELLAVQDAIAEQVAGAIEPELLKSEALAGAARRSRGDSTAQDLVHQGTSLFHQVYREGHLKARELFRQACRLDPLSGQAQFWLARVSAGIVVYGWSRDEEADLREAIAAAVNAIRLDEKSPYAHYALAIASVVSARFEDAVRAAQRAVDLAPGFALGHLVMGMARLYAGDAPGAIVPLERGLHLNAFDPQNFVWCNTLAYAYLFTGQAERGFECARRAQEIRPDWAPATESAICCLVALGRMDAAGKAAAQLRGMSRLVSDALSPLRRHNPQWDRQLQAWMRQAQTSIPS